MRLNEIDAEIEKFEQQIFLDLCGELKKSGEFLYEISENLGVIDTLLSLAQKMVRHNWVIPNITDEPEVYIKNGWHPVLEKIYEDSGNLHQF